MKLLIHSNAPYVGSGYGTQTGLFARIAKEAGHEVVVRGFFGHHGAIMQWGGVTILPQTAEGWGNDSIPDDYERHQPDAFVLLIDIWVYQDDVLKSAPLTAWAPIDHTPIPPHVAHKLRLVKHVWAMSRHGETEMRRAGINPLYVPHGVDTDIFKPIDRAKARRAWKFEDDEFVVVMVAANKGNPSRKSFEKVIKAWGKFAAARPDAVLYLHTDPTGHNQGHDLMEMAAFYGIAPKSIRFADTQSLRDGEYGPDKLNTLYNAADFHLLPSAGEGFGIPAIEAQAAGCPVIVTDFSAQSELAGPGYKIEIDPFDDLVYTIQGSEQAMLLRPSKIVTALEWAYASRGNEQLRAESREFAMEYDARRVWRDFMLPAIEQGARDRQWHKAIEAGRDDRTAARLALRVREHA